MSNGIADSRNVRIQGVGSVVTELNKQNLAELYKTLHKVNTYELSANQTIEHRLGEALEYVDAVRNFVGTPEHILGNPLTKHGEIAEHLDVNIQNAWSVFNGERPVASFEGVGRTAPEDYIVDGVKVQSKYINGSSNSLDAVLGHLEQYQNIAFGRDGSYYVIPKDQYAEIQQVLSGNTNGLSARTVRAIREKVKQIEEETRRSFTDVVKPGTADYAEVQQGAIHKTLDQKNQEFQKTASENKKTVEQESQAKRDAAKQKAAPSWEKAGKAAGIAAGISGGMQLAFGIQRKCQAGTSIQNFTIDDWKELGIDTTKAAAEGGISGLALYGMTEVLHIPTPVAGAGISMAFGLIDLTHEYCKGTMSKADYIAGCQTVSINAVVCAVGAWLGDAIIPIPVLGSILGAAIASNLFNEVCGKGAYEAITNASYYVRGATVATINSLNEISTIHKQISQKLFEGQIQNARISKKIDDLYAQLGGSK